jgi:hypothetical protein
MLDTLARQSQALSGVGAEVDKLSANVPGLLRALGLKTEQIASLESQLAQNESRNDFLLSQIVQINESSTATLLNSLWTLTSDPRNRESLATDEPLFAFLIDQLAIATSPALLRPVVGVLANFFSVPRTRDAHGDAVIDAIGRGDRAGDVSFNQLLLVMLYNLSFSGKLTGKFLSKSWMAFLKDMIGATPRAPRLLEKAAKFTRQLVTITKDEGVFQEYLEEFKDLCTAVGICGRSDPISTRLCGELGL